MSNDLVSRMRAATTLASEYLLLDEAANEIERIHGLLREASQAKTWGDAQALIDAALGDRHE